MQKGEPGWFRLTNRLANGVAYLADNGFTKGDTGGGGGAGPCSLIVPALIFPIKRALSLKLPLASLSLSSVRPPAPPPPPRREDDPEQPPAGQDVDAAEEDGDDFEFESLEPGLPGGGGATLPPGEEGHSEEGWGGVCERIMAIVGCVTVLGIVP